MTYPDQLLPSFNVSFFYNGNFTAIIYEAITDGYDDLVIYGWGPQSDHFGNVFVFFGGEQLNTNCALRLVGTHVDENLGNYMATGDINGDGYDDILVSRRLPVNDTTLWNYVLDIYSGGTTLSNVPVFEIPVGLGNNGSLYSLIANGDLNGDGYDDIITVYNSFGETPGLTLKVIYGLSDFDSLSIQDFDFSPVAVKVPLFYCNFDNDPYSDFCVWQYSNDDNFGHFTAYRQADPILDLTCDFMNTGELYTNAYGRGYLLGDMNNDGYQEFFVFSFDGFPQNTNYATILTEHYVGISDNAYPIRSSKLICYPNPFRDRVTISLPNKAHHTHYNMSIFDVKGRMVYQRKDITYDKFIWNPDADTKDELKSGIYFIKIIDNNRVIKTSKVVYTK